jgi:hypothetical protein
MKVIRNSTADEAVLAWLLAELDSTRFGGDLANAITKADCSDSIIRVANLLDRSENDKRWRILKSYRGWLDTDFNSYDWRLVELDQNGVAGLEYIDYSYWNELSDNTRKVKRAADNVRKGKVVFEVSNGGFFSIAKEVEAGKELPPIIVVSVADDAHGEILEGHRRATGYALASSPTQPLAAIWGLLLHQ